LKASLTTSSRSSGQDLEFPIEVDSEHYDVPISPVPRVSNGQRLYANMYMYTHLTAHQLNPGSDYIFYLRTAKAQAGSLAVWSFR
jgi:hypothetical protein